VNCRIVTFSIALCCTVIAGCGDFKSEFSLNQQTDELIQPARDEVVKQLAENFGTPEDLIASTEYPIDYGSPESVKVSVEQFDPGTRGVLTISGLTPSNEDGLDGAVLRLAGGDKHDITRFDGDSGQIHVTPGIESELKAGDQATVITKPHGWKLKLGRNLYMRHCLHCHGVSGDGNGPTAQYLNPRPRDYRSGKLKFTSTISTEKATREDIERILFNGIPGTSMPSFKLKLIDDDMSAVVEYVRFLATRGEYELKLGGELKGLGLGGSIAEMQQYLRDEKEASRQSFFDEFQASLTEDLPDTLELVTSDLADSWQRAEAPESLVLPKKAKHEATPESIARGRALYISKDAKCSDCHGMAGYGDGAQTEAFLEKPGSGGLTYDKPGLYDDWGQPIKPRNLRKGMYRGGRRPIDIYRRISAGIKGTPMPGFGTSLNDDQIWDIVNYVMTLPYEEKTTAVSAQEKPVAAHTVK